MRRSQPGAFRVIKDVLFYLLVAIIIGIFVFPLLWAVLLSFKSPMEIISLSPTLLKEPTLVNYQKLFQSSDIPFVKYFLNSVIISISSTVLSVALAAFAGYSLSRIMPVGSSTITVGILAARMLPPIVIILPLYLIYTKLGLMDTLIGLIIPYTALNIPLATWLLRSFFLGLPNELEEAAAIDGCNRFEAFLKVILPLAAPGLATTAIFSFELAWNDYLLALPLTNINAVPLTVVASMVRTEEGVAWGKLGAVITIMIIPVFLITLFSQRYLVSGLVSGSVKE